MEEETAMTPQLAEYVAKLPEGMENDMTRVANHLITLLNEAEEQNRNYKKLLLDISKAALQMV